MSPTTTHWARIGISARCGRPLPGVHRRAQRGAALLVILTILVLLTSAILLDQLSASVQPSPSRDPGSVEQLARAKEALIAWAASHPDTPGLLPFPDRNDDATANYDGAADCVAPGAIAPGHLLGSFPIRGEQGGCAANIPMSMDVEDSAGERLWYAVSQNLVRGGGGGPVNPDIRDLGAHPWITVRDALGNVILDPDTGLALPIAAVIIAPGAALPGQDRSAAAPAATHFLDSLVVGANTYLNSDADGCSDVACGTPGEEFIINANPQPGDNFNDRLVYITVEELMRAVEDRVIGEAANALKAYRSSNPGDYYPWMSTFSDPRSPQGAATGGSATSLVDAGTDFLVAGVSDGDLVRNLTDGSIGPVATGGVTATTLTLEGLIGGTTNTFVAGDTYVVSAPDKFHGDPGAAVDGMLPLHFPNEVFQTGFTVNWNFAGEKNDDVGGDPALHPTIADVDNFNGADLTIPDNQGACKWTQSNRVDCRGFAVLPNTPAAGITRTVEVWFNFTANVTTVVSPTATSVRRRNHTYNGPYDGPVIPVAAPDMPQETWSVRITDDDGILVPGWRLAVRDASTDLVINKFDGIRYEIDVPNELPAWFVDNNWQHFVHAAISGAHLPATAATSGDGICETPPIGPGNENDDCLSIAFNATTVRDDVAALVVGPGAVLPAIAQDRNAGTACPSHPAFLCDYFESPNSDDESPSRNMIFGRALANTFSVSNAFNDQIRAVPP